MDEQIRIAMAYAKEQKQKYIQSRNGVRKTKRQQNEFELTDRYQSSSFKTPNHDEKRKVHRQVPTSNSIISNQYYPSNQIDIGNDVFCINNDLTESDNTSDDYLTSTEDDSDLNMSCYNYNIIDTQNIPAPITRLHHFTNISTNEYCRNLAGLLRDAKICKSHSNQLISIIKSVLPHPNYMPSSTNELYRLMNVDNLFIKRKVCITCQLNLPFNENICHQCQSTDQKTTATIFDVDVHKVLSLLLQRLHKNIEEYREKALKDNKSGQLNDIIFNKLYSQLVNKLLGENIISMVLHLDGVGLTKSTKLKLWLFSGSIVELPPTLRYRRYNMPLLSIWVGYTGPLIHLWLDNIINKLNYLKSHSIFISPDIQYKLKCFAITGDCPAIRLALDFISHGGYYCCWICYLRGIHVGKKRQYYCELPIKCRHPEKYLQESIQALKEDRDVYGHRGVSILHKILDTELPDGILIDYLHCTLLGHAKTVIKAIYRQLKPEQRVLIDVKIKQQRFPHFFGRKTRPISDFAHVKATEIRNLLLYTLLPVLQDYLPLDQLSHLALFVCSIRIFHSEAAVDDDTCLLGHNLFVQFYKHHGNYYVDLQNFVLHLHIHYCMIYKNYGSLCNIGCFGQEDLIGSISSNHHGTILYGELIAYYYNIDFFLNNNKNFENVQDGPIDSINRSPDTVTYAYDCHKKICDCSNMNKCIVIHRRCLVNGHMFHSLLYTKRQQCISYFVQYFCDEDSKQQHFGAIEYFFTCGAKSLALIQHYPTKHLYSKFFQTSKYFDLLKKALDSFFFVLQRESSRLDLIPVEQILIHCIVIEANDHLIVTPISSYNEHD